MIVYDDVLAVYPNAAQAEPDAVQSLIDVANTAFPDDRFKGSPDRGRALYVAHMLQVKVDPKAPHVLAQMNRPKPHGRKPHVWDATEHGKQLKLATKY